MSPRFTALRPIEKLPILFWKYYINHEPMMRNVLANATKAGTMMNELVIQDYLVQKIPIPDHAEQEKIGKVFHTCDALLTLHQRKCEKLKNIKKALLEKMFV